MAMTLDFIDFETYWDTTHSLSKMSPIEYVMHENTEIISMSLKRGNAPTEVWFGEDEIREVLSSCDFSNSMLVAHNMAGFDAMILAWRFGVRPKMWGCTLSMARPIHAITVGNSLAKLVKHYELGEKDNTILLNTKGRHLCDFTEYEREQMRIYNMADTDQCCALFHKLKKHYLAKELWHIDATIRMLVEPKLVLDKKLLEDALVSERVRKRDMLRLLAERMGSTEDQIKIDLASAPKFSKLLELLGMPVPMKPSPSDPEKMIPALAKTDQGFIDLTESNDELVSLAARTRLDVKSTLLETRLETFISTGRCTRGKFPVPLHYCGAITTGRWSGWLYNPQNLPRVPRDHNGKIVPKLSNALRRSIRAPKGSKVVVADLSGIELRVNHFLWKVRRSMQMFQDDPGGADLYRDFASALYKVEPGAVEKAQRQIGKVAHLGLGFGAGTVTFKNVAKIMGGIDLDENEAEQIKSRWRFEYSLIVEGWQRCQDCLPYVESGLQVPIDPWNLVYTCQDGLELPSGRIIRYPGLRRETGDRRMEWVYGHGRHKAHIYGGKVVENIVQALARDVLADYSYDVFKRTGYRPALTVHDELVYVAPDSEAEALLETVHEVMRTPPVWWKQLVTWSDGDIADSYGEAK